MYLFQSFSILLSLILTICLPAQAQIHPPGFPPPSNSIEVYRGFGGRTLNQAYLKCAFEALKESSNRKSQRYQEIMEACMVAEGFFKERKNPYLDDIHQYMPPTTNRNDN